MTRSFIMTLCVTTNFFTQAQAGPDRISILLGSEHVGAEPSLFEETNPGIFLTWEHQHLDASIGTYRNSYGKTSIAAVLDYPIYRADEFRFSAFAGLAYYPDNGRKFAVSIGDVVPLAGLQTRYKNAFLQVIPQDGRYVDAIVSFGVTFELD